MINIAGVDEVGRGPLVGDVVTAAVILHPDRPIKGLADSKVLSEKKRVGLYSEILKNALAVSVGRCSAVEIDHYNILAATLLAMKRAVDSLSIKPCFVRVDGNRLPDWDYPSEAIVKGDSKDQAISAASIIAKVTRDREMFALHDKYPEYGFDRHKGYPTKQHLEALATHGVLRQYRMSFKPVAQALLVNNGVIRD